VSDTWNPQQYERFKAERAQPFHDLVSLALSFVSSPKRVVDLGCGTGELTRDLHRKSGARETVGLDSSEAMLTKARAFAGEGLDFVAGTVESFSPTRPFELVFSNAALHWVPDHERLFARLATWLAPGGVLAIQLPANQDHPTHVTAEKLASGEFAGELEGFVKPPGVLRPEQYADLLHRLGFTRQQVELRVYGHVLPSKESVLEWVKGSLLTDYQRRLSPESFARFMTRYRERLLAQLADTQPYFYPFKRILFAASR
jgi:trans-aconitate 2-methyltransferase